MTTGGWCMMIGSVGSVIALTSFCLYCVFMLPPQEIESLDVARLSIHPRDTEDPASTLLRLQMSI